MPIKKDIKDRIDPNKTVSQTDDNKKDAKAVSKEHVMSQDQGQSEKNKIEDKDKPIKKSKAHSPIKKFILGLVAVIIILIVFLLIMGLGIVGYNWDNAFAKKIAEVVPYPAILFNNKILSYSLYQQDLNTLDEFLQNQDEEITDGDINDIKKMILLRMVRDSLIGKKAEENNISVSDGEVNEEFEQIVEIAESEGKSRDELYELLGLEDYNWDENEFKNRALRPYILYEKLKEWIAFDETINADAKKKSDEVLALVQGGKQTFEELAGEYNEDLTVGSGGDLGFFERGGLPSELAEFEKVAFSLETGQTSGIVRTQYGYHIIKIIEKVPATSSASEQIHVAHILIMSKHVEQWIEEELSKSRVTVLVPGFGWQSDCNLVLLDSETCDNNSNSQNDSQNVNDSSTNQ